MRLLDKLELMLTEEKESYKLYPVDYDLESGVSFGVDLSDDDDDNALAKVAIKTIDGVPIDALNGNYNYDDVYADVDIEGDTDDPKNADLMLWVLKKLKNMGYDEQSIRFDGDTYYKKHEIVSDVTDDENEPVESDAEFDPSSYWDDTTEELDSDYQPPKEPDSNDSEEEEEETDGDSKEYSDDDTDDADDSEEEEEEKTFPWEKKK